MNSKKLLVLSLTALSVISLSSCGGKNDNTSNSGSDSINSNEPNNNSNSIIDENNEVIPEGSFRITWKNGTGSSYKLVDGGNLPHYAEKDKEIKFKIFLEYDIESTPKVSCNDVELVPTDGIYKFTVDKEITIKTEDYKVEYGEKTILSDYYIAYADTYTLRESNRLTVDKYPVLSDLQSYIVDVGLKKETKLKIINSVTQEALTNFELVNGDIPGGTLDKETGIYTATDDAIYSFYVKTTGDVTSVYVNVAKAAGVVINGLEDGFAYYVWAWGGVGGSQWLSGEYDGGSIAVTLPAGTTGFLVVQFEEGLTNPNWDDKIKQTGDMTPVLGVSTYTADWM